MNLDRLRRAHTLTGVVPLGVFLVVHSWTNAHVLWGRQSFDDAVGRFDRWPGAWLIELVLIALPLAFHALYGLKLTLDAWRARAGTQHEPWTGQSALIHATGVVALVFLGYHLGHLTLPRALGITAPGAFHSTLSASLSSTTFGLPLAAMAYLIGIVSTILHFAVGTWRALVNWPLVESQRARLLAAIACSTVGVVLFVAGVATTLHFATGVISLGAPSRGESEAQECDLLPPLPAPRAVPAASAPPAASALPAVSALPAAPAAPSPSSSSLPPSSAPSRDGG